MGEFNIDIALANIMYDKLFEKLSVSEMSKIKQFKDELEQAINGCLSWVEWVGSPESGYQVIFIDREKLKERIGLYRNEAIDA